MTTFDTAKYYRIAGCDHYETPEECLEEFAYDFCSRLRLDVDALAKNCPVIIHAYALADRVRLDFDNMSDDMMTTFEEEYADANLGLTDNIDKLKNPNAYRACKQAIMSALLSFEATLTVTKLSDKPIASRTYSADEVLAVLRRVKPAWFREVG